MKSAVALDVRETSVPTRRSSLPSPPALDPLVGLTVTPPRPDVTSLGWPAISMMQPWASVVGRAIKTVDNRKSWHTLRGEILLHAGKGVDPAAPRMIEDACRSLGFDVPDITDTPKGVLLGTITIEKQVGPLLVPPKDSVWAEGPCCHLISEVRLFAEPIPWRGMSGVFRVPYEIVAAAIEGARLVRPPVPKNVEAEDARFFEIAIGVAGDPDHDVQRIPLRRIRSELEFAQNLMPTLSRLAIGDIIDSPDGRVSFTRIS